MMKKIIKGGLYKLGKDKYIVRVVNTTKTSAWYYYIDDPKKTHYNIRFVSYPLFKKITELEGLMCERL